MVDMCANVCGGRGGGRESRACAVQLYHIPARAAGRQTPLTVQHSITNTSNESGEFNLKMIFLFYKCEKL